MRFDRRTLLIGGGAGVGLIVAISLWPRHWKSGLDLARGEQAFGPFIKISNGGRITIAMPQVETGQGIWTALPQIVADELGASWETIGVEPAPLMKGYESPLAKSEGWPEGIRITANSTSVRAFERPLRQAAALARTMLIGAAADRWNVDPGSCDTADGFVINGVRTFTFGELAEEAADRSAPLSAPLRTSKAPLMGRPLQRLDGPAKVDGSWRFAGDVRLKGMLFASVRLAPPGGQLTAFSRRRISTMPGVRHVTANSGWIAVVADSWWQAEQALRAAGPRFSGELTAPDMRGLFNDAITKIAPSKWFARGNYEAAVQGSRPLAATYYVAPSQHLGLEPDTATARVTSDGIELWSPTQAPGFGHQAGTLYPLPAGEPAGRAMESNAAPIAVELARAVGRPVQLVISQSVSQNHDRSSPGALGEMTALPGEGGITAAWAMRVATGDGLAAAFARLSGVKPREKLGQSALEGSVPPYSIPNVRIETVRARLPFLTGYMRGSPQREFAFFTESFIDELARAAGMEPLAFRMSMLGSNGRLARCLQAAARLANWDGGAPGSTMGIAGATAFGSHIGLVANASIGEDQKIKVHRLVAAVDCGQVVNTDLAGQQVEAGLLWALAQAKIASPEWIAGMPRARPIGALDPLRVRNLPQVQVEIIPSSDASGGLSGLGTLPLAPAVANAIHAATGKRLRALPFEPMASS